jgi:ABC-type nitrate/sulfonate/bicarbonate transport system substrate-binding protein
MGLTASGHVIFAAAAIALAAIPSAARAETPLNMAVVSRTVFYLPAWVAQKRGFFKAAGLDVTMKVYDGSDQIYQDLRANTQQIAVASTESVIADAYNGGVFRLIAGNSQRPPHFIIAQPEIKTLADLKGKLMGVVSMHEGTTFFVPDIAKKAGLNAGDIKIEAVGGSPTRMRLLKERKIDAGMQPYPLSYEADAQGFSNLGPVADIVPDYQFSAVIVDDDWARANRPVVAAYLRALREGTAYMFAHPDEVAAIGAIELRTTPALARRAIDDTARMDIMPRDLSLTDASLRRVFDNVKAAGLVGPQASYDRAKFVDESYLIESRNAAKAE